MDIKDMVIDEIIKARIIEMQAKIINYIDNKLDILHEVICGRKTHFEVKCANYEEAKVQYNRLVVGRNILAIPVNEFKKLEEEEILKALCVGYATLEIFFIHEK